LAKTNKENSIMIGDCIEADVQGAINFGMRAILFDEKNTNISNDVEKINHLLELKKII
jgi:putative hydrolase of the HAD superfamily